MLKALIIGLLFYIPLNVFAEIITHNGVTYGTVTSPYTGRVWLDRNLGASQVCTAYNDTACFGDYYQWGRNADGHEKSTSSVIYVATTDLLNAGSDYILYNPLLDWTTVDNDGIQRSQNWSVTDGNSVCPVGYRVPTIIELEAETIGSIDGMFNHVAAYNNFLKLPSAGYRNVGTDGSMLLAGSQGIVWSSSNNTNHSTTNMLTFYSGNAYTAARNRANGASVRCIQDTIQQNTAPTANAGADQSVASGTTVTLSASSSTDSDGNITSYEWKEGSTILGTGSTLIKSNFSVGTHTITLTVTDNSGATASDEVVVTVNEIQKEILNYNGTVTNSLDFTHAKRYYEFTLTEKSRVKINTTDLEFHLGGYIKDNTNKIISQFTTEYFSSSIDTILDAGTYTLEIFSTNMKSGNYSFTFNTNNSFDVSEYEININKNIILYYGGVSKTLFSMSKFKNKMFNVTSSNLPQGWKIEKNHYDEWNLLVGDIPSDSFEVVFHITNEEIEFDKTYTIKFTVDNYKIDAVRGTGKGSKVAIQLDENNVTKPIKLSFNINSENIATKINSVECLFGYQQNIGFVSNSTNVISSGAVQYECDATKTSSFIGVNDIDSFVSSLNNIEYYDRVLSVKINQKDGTYITKTIHKPIPAEYSNLNHFFVVLDRIPPLFETENYIFQSPYPRTEIKIKKSNETEFTTEIVTVGTLIHFNLDDTIVLSYGNWLVAIGTHHLNLSMGEKNSNFLIRITQDVLNDEDIVNYSFMNEIDPTSDFELMVKRVESIPQHIEDGINTLKMVRNFLGEGSYFDGYYADNVAGVRGTTFIISGDNNNTKFDVLEGIVDINKSGITTTLNSMETLDLQNGKKATITSMNLAEEFKTYLDDTSLSQSDFNTTISRLNIITNLAESSYVLIGDNVRVGSGTVNSFNNIAEGNYTLRFLPVVGKITPPEIPFVVTKEASDISLDGNYSDGLKLNDGWSLIGLGTDVNVTNTHWNALFGSAKIMWKYKDSTWKAYSSFDTIKSAINTAGYTLFDTINAGEGVWIQSDTNQTLAIDTSESTYQLNIPTTKGWHLKSTPQTISVTSFTANRTDITYVWTYNNGTWALWAKDGLQRGFDSLDTIYAHAGFWALVR